MRGVSWVHLLCQKSTQNKRVLVRVPPPPRTQTNSLIGFENEWRHQKSKSNKEGTKYSNLTCFGRAGGITTTFAFCCVIQSKYENMFGEHNLSTRARYMAMFPCLTYTISEKENGKVWLLNVRVNLGFPYNMANMECTALCFLFSLSS